MRELIIDIECLDPERARMRAWLELLEFCGVHVASPKLGSRLFQICIYTY